MLLLAHKAVVLSKEPWLAALQPLLPGCVTNTQRSAPGWASPASSRATCQLWLSHSNPSSHERPSRFFSVWDYLTLKSTTVSGLEGAHGGFPKLKPHLKCLESEQQQQQSKTSQCLQALCGSEVFLWLGTSRAIFSSTPGFTLGDSSKNLLQVFRSLTSMSIHVKIHCSFYWPHAWGTEAVVKGEHCRSLLSVHERLFQFQYQDFPSPPT